MEYSNLEIVTNVAIPYTSKIEESSLEQKQINQSSIHNTSTTLLQNEKNSTQSARLSEPFRFAPGSYQELTFSPEMIATQETQNTLIGALINLLRKNSKMRYTDIVDYVRRNINTLTRLSGTHYTGSPERITLGALHSTSAFIQVGCGMWSLNPELANETEKDIFRRCLEREKTRKRKRRSIHQSETIPYVSTPEQMETCLSRALNEIRQQQILHKTNPSPTTEAFLSLFTLDGLSYLSPDDPTSEDHDIIEDPFSFLQQDPFENVSLSDWTRKIKQKYGDEGFCFIMQFFNFFKQFLVHPNDMAEKTSIKIESALQEIKNDSSKSGSIPDSQHIIRLDELNESGNYEVSKRRKTSIQEDVMFEDNITINYPISQETIPYSSIHSLPQSLQLSHYFPMMSNVNQGINPSIQLGNVYEEENANGMTQSSSNQTANREETSGNS